MDFNQNHEPEKQCTCHMRETYVGSAFFLVKGNMCSSFMWIKTSITHIKETLLRFQVHDFMQDCIGLLLLKLKCMLLQTVRKSVVPFSLHCVPKASSNKHTIDECCIFIKEVVLF